MSNIIDFNKKAKGKNKEPETVGETPKTSYDILHEGVEYRFFIDIGVGYGKYTIKYLSKEQNISPSELITCVLSGKHPDDVKEVWRTLVSKTISFNWFYRIIFLDNERAFIKFHAERYRKHISKLLIKTFIEIQRRRTASESFLKSIETQ